MTHQRSGWVVRIILFVVFVSGFFGAAFAIPGVLIRFARLLPENYAQNAADLMWKGDYASAQRACERRIQKFAYDFTAHYLLADVLARQKRHDQAARTIKSIIAKVPAARSNKAAALGYDEPRTYALLAQYLWAAGNYFEAGEMARAASDAGAPVPEISEKEGLLQSLGTQEAAVAAGALAIKTRDEKLFARVERSLEDMTTKESKVSAALLLAQKSSSLDDHSTKTAQILQGLIDFAPQMPAPRLALAYYFAGTGAIDAATTLAQEVRDTTSSRLLNPQDFKTGVGTSVTSGALHIGRNGIVQIKLNTGVYRVTNLMFGAVGSQALAMYPILIIRCGTDEVMRIYCDSKTPRVYDLPLWPKGAPKSLDLSFEFINDEYDPFTKADRNVSLTDILLY